MRVFLILFIVLAGCAKAKHTEYLIGGQWQRCDYIATEACGVKLNCAGTVMACLNDLQSRNQ